MGVVVWVDTEITAGRLVVEVTPQTPKVAVLFGEIAFCELMIACELERVTLPPQMLLVVVPLRSITSCHGVLTRPTLATVP
jgi:hypothetical protein